MEIACKELPEALRNKPIRDFAIRQRSGANIIGMKTAQGDLIMNPSPDTKLLPESKLFVLGTLEEIESLKDLLKDENQ
jgi:K+/H+ antiporter YhaU regulatory subunit KhtT